MALSNQELLQKAMTTTTDFGGAGQAPLSIAQVTEFLLLALTPQVMLPDVRTVMSPAATWQESKLDFAQRVLYPGTQATRLSAGQQTKPTTSMVQIVTTLLRGEVPISDEVFEDNVAQEGFADNAMALIAQAAGRDIEDLMVNGNTGSGDVLYATDNGWLQHAQTDTGNHIYNASADGQDYQTIFKKMLNTLPDKYKRDIANLRYYVPKRVEEIYRNLLASRGTGGGDQWLTGAQPITYQGIQIVGVPLLVITAGAPDTTTFILSHRLNLLAGFRREVKLETFRDPREGDTSFVVTCRVDAEIENAAATVVATNVNCAI